MKNEFLQVASVAEWLGLTKKRVYALIQEGRLEALRFGPHQTRIPRQSVEALIARLAREHAAPRDLDVREGREFKRRAPERARRIDP